VLPPLFVVRIDNTTAAIGRFNVPCCVFPFAAFAPLDVLTTASQQYLFTNLHSVISKQDAVWHDDGARIFCQQPTNSLDAHNHLCSHQTLFLFES
jgi:hypothetical protein